MNAIVKQPQKDIMQIHEEFTRLENKAIGHPTHPINDGLNAYFAEIKRKLEALRDAGKRI